MKFRILTLLLTLGFIFLSCDNSNSEMQFESTATISGFDLTLCGCCGGWIININEEGTVRRFTELPKNSNIDLQNSTFPITVKLNWTESDEYCGAGIIIKSIELVE